MPLPAIAAGAGALAARFAPEILSVVGSLAAPIISSLAGAKNERQARDSVAPQYNMMIQRLMSHGLGRVEAERAAEEALSGEVQKAKAEGALPGWAELLGSAAGGIGGWALGKKLLAKGAKAAVADAATAAANPRSIPKPPPSMTARKKDAPDMAYFQRKQDINAANKKAADAGEFDQVLPEGEAGGALIVADAKPMPIPMEPKTAEFELLRAFPALPMER